MAYVVTRLSRFLDNPGQQHWKATIRVLRYLKTTRDFGVAHNRNDGKIMLEAYTDADWGRNLDDRRSVSGIMIKIGGSCNGVTCDWCVHTIGGVGQYTPTLYVSTILN